MYWFDLDPIDDSYLETADFVYTYDMDLRAGADEVWRGLTGAEPLSWCRLLDVHYTSVAPHSTATTRVAKVAGGFMQLREQFFVWDEEQRRHAFYVKQANVPLFRSFAEDYRVEPTPTGCRFVWTFAFTARRGFGVPVRLALPVNKALFASFARDTRKHFGAVN
ncbi:SRPBCC family protein [Rhodococcus maanshanensis]|uniref:SRPBCC family protein n=1 Tax=Rhodococcus maanshanensis TaxID=183556 RepID=UPI0022B4927F|nr:SRPBCC family protein [Rhodococcus maanshanensis]MCZ4557621.1 SRPBCC family protein [Rhodococcus maanshanensis]